MIKHSSSGHQVLFDTCDLWVSKESTAAASGKILSSMLKLGDPVKFHAVLVHSSSEPHYLATAVWKMVEGSPIFGDGLAPVAIRRDAIHRDKIEIFKTVITNLNFMSVLCSTTNHEHLNVRVLILLVSLLKKKLFLSW